MGHFAKIENNTVVNVIVAEQDFVDNQSGTWVQTSYNTRGGVHYVPNSDPPTPSDDQSKALRANFATIGGTYDSVNDVFYAPKPFPSWILDTATWLWKAPIDPLQVNVDFNPDIEIPVWDEETTSWKIIPVND
jgi:hypothetical protein